MGIGIFSYICGLINKSIKSQQGFQIYCFFGVNKDVVIMEVVCVRVLGNIDGGELELGIFKGCYRK